MRRWLILAILSMATGAHALGSGITSAQQLKLLRGARPAALAGAYTALVDGADAILYNPAGLTQLRTPQAGLGHMAWLDGVSDDYLQIGLPIYGFGAWGLGMTYLYAQDQARDNWGNPGDIFGIFDFSAQIALAIELGNDLSVGGTYKILRQGYDNRFSMGSAFDLGAQWRDFFGMLDLGAAMLNMGTPTSLGESRAPLPWTMRAGIALRLNKALRLVADHDHQPLEFINKSRFGVEYGRDFEDIRGTLRMGYQTGPENQAGNMAGWAFGLGAKYNSYNFDYAFTPLGDLGVAHRLGMTINFGGN